MAYPTIDAPYGLRPVKLIGDRPYTHGMRQVSIASGEGTSIFFGDVVKLNSAGNLTKETGTDAAALVLGVFMGCSYTSPATNQKLFAQFYPASTVASDIVGYVCDDPDAVFKVAVCSSGLNMSGVARTAIGNTTALIQNSGLTATGNSRVAVSATTVTTTSLAVKIIDGVPDTVNSLGSFTEVLVVWNSGAHFYRNNSGI